MARDLIEQAREIGGDELAEQVEELVNELESDEQDLEAALLEKTDLSESTVAGMTDRAKQEVALELLDRTNAVEIPVAGRPDAEPTNEIVNIERSGPETSEREVEIPVAGGDDDPDTMTVEYANRGPSVETINEFTQWLNQARHEASEPAPETESVGGGIPSTEYMNAEDVETDADIPVAGGGDEQD